MKTLADLLPGEIGVAEAHGNERLKRLGLVTGTEVMCIQKSPLGDPVAYRIRGTVFAIRKCDGEMIPLSEGGD